MSMICQNDPEAIEKQRPPLLKAERERKETAQPWT